MREVTKENLTAQIDRLYRIKEKQGQLSMNNEYTLQAYEMLLATMNTEPVVPDAATAMSAKNAQIKPVADLYAISVPGGRRTTYSTDAAEASDFRAMGWSVQEYVKLERYQSTMLNQK